MCERKRFEVGWLVVEHQRKDMREILGKRAKWKSQNMKKERGQQRVDGE